MIIFFTGTYALIVIAAYAIYYILYGSVVLCWYGIQAMFWITVGSFIVAFYVIVGTLYIICLPFKLLLSI